MFFNKLKGFSVVKAERPFYI